MINFKKPSISGTKISIKLCIATALETLTTSSTLNKSFKLKKKQTKRLKTTVHISFILVGLSGIHLLSHE